MPNRCSDLKTARCPYRGSTTNIIKQNDKITVEYSAINNNGAGTVENYSNLSYGDGNTTVGDKAEVNTYSFLIVKWDGRYTDITFDNAKNAVLYTAKFKLYDQGGTAIQFIAPKQTEIDSCWYGDKFQSLRYEVWNESVDSTKSENTKTDTIVAGFSEIQGLKAGTYYLVEDQAPAGFNKIAGRIEIVIDNNGVFISIAPFALIVLNQAKNIKGANG